MRANFEAGLELCKKKNGTHSTSSGQALFPGEIGGNGKSEFAQVMNVIPANAGMHFGLRQCWDLDSRFRSDHSFTSSCTVALNAEVPVYAVAPLPMARGTS